MGLSVVLGLQRFFFEEPDEHQASVVALVRAGLCPVLRERIPGHPGVFEARMTADGLACGWLSASQADEILRDWQALFPRENASASLSQHEAHLLGCHTVVDLALPADLPAPTRLSLPGDRLHRLVCTSLARSLESWPADLSGPEAQEIPAWEVQTARKLHLFAARNAFLLHSA